MLHMPPPLPPKKMPYEIVREVQEEVHDGLFKQTLNVAQEDDLLAGAEHLKKVFADGFQWEDFSTIVRLSIEFIDQFQDMNEKEKRDCVVKIIDYFIEITDTPYLPDNITDPIFKALVPPFVDLTISAHKGELLTKGARRYSKKAGMPNDDDLEAFFAELRPLLEGDFAWENVLEAVQEGFAYSYRYVDLNREELKEITYRILVFIVDVTVWPYGLDLVLDPVTNAIMLPVIDLVFDAI